MQGYSMAKPKKNNTRHKKSEKDVLQDDCGHFAGRTGGRYGRHGACQPPTGDDQTQHIQDTVHTPIPLQDPKPHAEKSGKSTVGEHFAAYSDITVMPVSYTHLTLPTIYSV